MKVDILERLNSEGSYEWVEDRFAPVTGTNVEHIYTTPGCSIWVFSSSQAVSRANESGVFGFFEGEVWYGQDSYSPKGAALLTASKDSRCGKVVFDSFGWSTQDSKEKDKNNSLEGTWGSYGWMQDNVGMFLKVRSAGDNSYQGTFYSQGQSGGVFKDFVISIVDLGDGLAEVTWPSGNTTTATWGKRNKNTPNDMDPKWNGDIWFDCVGEADFAKSRADCNFYFLKN